MVMGVIEPAPSPAAALAPLIGFAKAVSAKLSAWKGPLFALCAVIFVVGLAISASRLELAWSDISPLPLVISALIIVPLSMANGALNFMILARGIGTCVSFGRAMKVSCVASFAEFLPVPGGAIVRGGALMREGTGAVNAGLHVTISALLWIACSAVAASAALGVIHPVALVIGIGGVVGVIACTWWLATHAGWVVAAAAIAQRLLGLVLGGARILTAFLAIGVSVGLLELYPFVFATIAGSAASIAPGGLGISEMIAAALAPLSTVPPEAAFLAVGLNRLVGLAVSGIATGIITVTNTNHGKTQDV